MDGFTVKIKLTDQSKENIHQAALYRIKYEKAEGNYFITTCWLKSVLEELNRLGIEIKLEEDERHNKDGGSEDFN